MDMDSSTGANRLGQTIAKRIVKHMEGESSLVLDFGEIKDDESLVTNTFPIPIPKGDYHVLRQLTYGKTGDILAKTQNIGKPGSGEHNHLKVTTLLDSRGMPCSGMVGTPALDSLTRPTHRRAVPAAAALKVLISITFLSPKKCAA